LKIIYILHGQESASDGIVLQRISPAGDVVDVAGSPDMTGYLDGVGASARFYSPTGIAIGPDGNIYVTEPSVVRRVTPAGEVTTLAGYASGYVDGYGSSARFAGISGVAIGTDGTIYVTEWLNDTVRRITASGHVTTIFRTLRAEDEPLTPLHLRSPGGIAIDSENKLYVANTSNGTINKITQDGVITSLTGARFVGTTAPSLGGTLHSPTGIVVTSTGTLAMIRNYGYGVVGFRDSSIGSPP
jgi:hypothetical protein